MIFLEELGAPVGLVSPLDPGQAASLAPVQATTLQ